MELRRRLLDGTPRIMLDDVSAKAGSIVIEPFSLQPGEAECVGAAIASVLRAAPARAAQCAPAGVDIAGAWIVVVELLRWPRRHMVVLRQETNRLTGTHATDDLAGAVVGELVGREIRFVIETFYEGALITFHFSGQVRDDEMAGEVLLGSIAPGTPGAINQRQYGSARWTARRATAA